MTAAFDLEDGEVFACTPIVATHDSPMRLTWADQGSSGEFIPREALELEEDYGGFTISTDFLRCSDVDIQKAAQPTAITSNANAPSNTITNQKAYNLADIVAYPSILTVGTIERDPHPTPYVSHETAEIQSYPTGSQSIDSQRGGGPPLTHSAVFIGYKGAGPAVKAGVITGLHRVSQGTTVTCSNAYQSGEGAPQSVVISHIPHNSPQVMQGPIPLVNTKGAIRPVTFRSNEEVSHLAYIGVGPNAEDVKLASLDLSTSRNLLHQHATSSTDLGGNRGVANGDQLVRNAINQGNEVQAVQVA
ncbi:hypothetical protein F0562_012018 [Nyssa sinensis]|uniref:Uncharacterized protein n=1 Tax=Nyssa sinensis TaxID=561372 RepID=A0A5J4ZU04_9ASTE|nr:hypothetical protein F0562_012018 [Nyssa sinensis]